MSETRDSDLTDLIFSAKGAQCVAGALVGYYLGGRSLLWAAVGGFGAIKVVEVIGATSPHASEPALIEAEEAASRKALASGK